MDVNTQTGPVRGLTTGTTTAFRGTTEPGGGGSRPPRAPAAWPEAREAAGPGRAAPQPPPRLAWVMGDHDADADEAGCLNLNVWTAGTATPKPVLVWFHGGG